MKLGMKLVIGAIIISLSGVTSFAFVVSAPAVEAQLVALNLKTETNQAENRIKWIESIQKAIQILNTARRQVQEIQNHIQQGKEQFEFWKTHAGNWQAILARVRTGAANLAIEQGTFCDTPNMRVSDLFPEESSVQGLAHAVEEAKKLMAGKQTTMSPNDLRLIVTRLTGQIPETENAGVAAFAQTSLEDDMAYLGRTNQAITELQTEKERIRRERDAKMRAGTFTEADKTEYEMADRDLQGQIQTLQLQTLLRVNQQLLVMNSMRLKNQNDAEKSRIEEYRLRQARSSFLGNNSGR